MDGQTVLKNKTSLLLMALSCALSVLSCILLYHFDNKYSAPGPQAINGILLLDQQELKDFPVLYLIHGWEFYNGALLSPENFQQDPPLPDEYIFIGQYGGFEAGDLSASPHGSASYRLNIIIPEQPRTYMLELPEIFSAYRLYINGKEAAGLGNPQPSAYRPETGNKAICFEAQDRIEILVAVSDFSHIYSGMVYPPAFGAPDSVAKLLSTRLVFRSVLCAAALTIGLLAILVGLLSRKNATALLYGLMCLFFVSYTSYPITQTLIHGFGALYAIENFSFCALLLIVMLLQASVCDIKNRSCRPLILFGLAVCLASLALPITLLRGNLRVMVFYSNLIAGYKWITAGFITVTALWAARKNSVYSRIMLYGILVFDCALIMDRILPLHEPILTGWFPELAGFVLVLAIGGVIGQEVAAEYRANEVLQERARSMERLSQMQRTYSPLLQKKIKEAQTARHDLHHHYVMISGFLESGQYGRLQEYMAEYRTAIHNNEPISYSQNEVADILARHYIHLAENHGIEITLMLNISPDAQVADADLCSLLSNLLENAVEACQRQTVGRRFITLTAEHKKSALAIHMENSCAGVTQNSAGFLSAKGTGRIGYGLESVKDIARRYAGTADFCYDGATRVFISTVLLQTLAN